jgi:hypothetical protein
MNAKPTSLEFLQAVYLNEKLPLSVRMRAAIESLSYEHPKLMAVAHFNGNFADELDKKIDERRMKLIEHVPVPVPEPVLTEAEQHAPEELKGNFSKLRRRI